MSSLGRWPSGRAIAFVGLVASLGLLVVAPGCSSDDAAAAACDSSKCKPGNTCLPLNGEVKCRKTCSSNSDPATSCPFGYTCVMPEDGNPSFCVEDNAKVTRTTNEFTKQPVNPWGHPCNAAGGLINKDCDEAQEFYCYAQSPTDGDAYCTRYACSTDRDCAAGYWCADINVKPNADSARRTIGQTEKVCLKRTYCSTCKVDLDCPALDGRPQRCVVDDAGAGFCTPECKDSSNCNYEARCLDVGLDLREDGSIPKVCYPRAGVCVGDGKLCSPCRTDLDCGDDGACVKGQYTTERACAKKSKKSCAEGESRGSCPESTKTSSEVAVLCLGGRIDEVPANYCHGFYEIDGRLSDTGCWTPNR